MSKHVLFTFLGITKYSTVCYSDHFIGRFGTLDYLDELILEKKPIDKVFVFVTDKVKQERESTSDKFKYDDLIDTYNNFKVLAEQDPNLLFNKLDSKINDLTQRKNESLPSNLNNFKNDLKELYKVRCGLEDDTLCELVNTLCEEIVIDQNIESIKLSNIIKEQIEEYIDNNPGEDISFSIDVTNIYRNITISAFSILSLVLERIKTIKLKKILYYQIDIPVSYDQSKCIRINCSENLNDQIGTGKQVDLFDTFKNQLIQDDLKYFNESFNIPNLDGRIVNDGNYVGQLINELNKLQFNTQFVDLKYMVKSATKVCELLDNVENNIKNSQKETDEHLKPYIETLKASFNNFKIAKGEISKAIEIIKLLKDKKQYQLAATLLDSLYYNMMYASFIKLNFRFKNEIEEKLTYFDKKTGKRLLDQTKKYKLNNYLASIYGGRNQKENKKDKIEIEFSKYDFHPDKLSDKQRKFVRDFFKMRNQINHGNGLQQGITKDRFNNKVNNFISVLEFLRKVFDIDEL